MHGTVAIVGLGRIGLPLALSFADHGLEVIGVEKQQRVIDLIHAGKMPFEETGTQELLERVVPSGRLTVTDSIHQAASADWIVRRLFGRELSGERERWLYVGDSTNDEAMFAAFPLSVGVANLLDFAERLRQWPAFITILDRGRGFVEVAEALLAVRGA